VRLLFREALPVAVRDFRAHRPAEFDGPIAASAVNDDDARGKSLDGRKALPNRPRTVEGCNDDTQVDGAA
jgi:hypothetical protein